MRAISSNIALAGVLRDALESAGLPAYDADGGFKHWGLSLTGLQMVTGDLTGGLGVNKNEVLAINARSVIDFSGNYDVTEGGRRIGSVARQGPVRRGRRRDRRTPGGRPRRSRRRDRRRR